MIKKYTFVLWATVLGTPLCFVPQSQAAPAEEHPPTVTQRKPVQSFLDQIRDPWRSPKTPHNALAEQMPLEGLFALFQDAQRSISDAALEAMAYALSNCSTPAEHGAAHAKIFDNARALVLFSTFREAVQDWQIEGKSLNPEVLPALLHGFVGFWSHITVTPAPNGEAGATPNERTILDTLHNYVLDGKGDLDTQIARIQFIFHNHQQIFSKDTWQNHLYTLQLLNRLFTEAEQNTEWATTLFGYVYEVVSNDLGPDGWNEMVNIIVPYMVGKHQETPDFDFATSPLQTAITAIQANPPAEVAGYVDILNQHLPDSSFVTINPGDDE